MTSLKTLREQRLMSKAELARLAGVSALTIDRIERGLPCRPDTFRKVVLALGYTPQDKDRLFPDISFSPPSSPPSDSPKSAPAQF